MSDASDKRTERKVWQLSVELMDQVRAFQEEWGLTSEVEAARRLLISALQLRESMPDILCRLKAKYAEEPSLRIIARDILVGHPQARRVHFDETAIRFELNGGALGRINKDGVTSIATEGGEWVLWPSEIPGQ